VACATGDEGMTDEGMTDEGMTDELIDELKEHYPTFLAFLASIPTALIVGTFLGAKIAISTYVLFMLVWFAIDSRGRLR